MLVPWHQYAIDYPSMQNRKHLVDPRIEGIRQALHRKMAKREHSQLAVAELTGVPQSAISRFLSGRCKRITKNILQLCKYAEFDTKGLQGKGHEERRLSRALHGALGDNPAATEILTQIVESLTPLLRTYNPRRPTHSSGGAHDFTHTR